MSEARFGVTEVQITGFRSARSVAFTPEQVCALVGGPSVGKSNVLEAVWRLLQRGRPEPVAGDVTRGGVQPIRLHAKLAGGGEIELEASGSGVTRATGDTLPVLFLPASLRSSKLVSAPLHASDAEDAAHRYFAVDAGSSSAAAANALVAGVERACAEGARGSVLLIEEPELFLRPQAQRYLYRLLRAFAAAGNQVMYSTHEPAFLNVGRLDELALVEHSPTTGTVVTQPRPLSADASFRALSEIDAERGELFMARAVLLVEGRTEKLSLPFVFGALGHDCDREGITIVDCGGKPNIPLFIRICGAAGIPCVAIHDRDAAAGQQPSRVQRALNQEIERLLGRGCAFELAPDFEAVAGMRGHRHKPAHAFAHFSRISPERVPSELRAAVARVAELAAR